MSHIDPTAEPAPLRPDWSSQLAVDGYVDFLVDRRKLLGLAGGTTFAFVLGLGGGWYAWNTRNLLVVAIGAYLVLMSLLVLAPRLLDLARWQGPLLRVTPSGLHLAGRVPLDLAWTEIDDIATLVRGPTRFARHARAHVALYVGPATLSQWRSTWSWWQRTAELLEHAHRPGCVYLPKALTGSADAIADWLLQEWQARGLLARP